MNHCISFDPISQLFFQENIPEETFWAQCSALIPVNSIAVYDKECENELNDDNGNCVTKPLYRTCTAAGWSESKMVDPNDTKLVTSETHMFLSFTLSIFRCNVLEHVKKRAFFQFD
jgi:hypothetical protein